MAATAFGGGSGDLGDVVEFTLDFDQSQFGTSNLVYDVTGSLPIQNPESDFGTGSDQGHKIRIVKSTAAIASGSEQYSLTVEIYPLGEEEGITATITITGASGAGYEFNAHETIHI